ncbi:hypothetical protein [Algoriphagus zhangzhouensis]|uniref:MetA-pathway of phenol degradation n=1 Tax=Algoriphagus zhangzhouensis TaxID=1073327 RepID=A0A1M7Z3J5_9BACT|nr:hypothetical protein [Algoriphagus zhangzhouensis]TDY48450.1 hypothetical protein A8938_0133 [Algoriphagus zhangzhouensis]SHO59497.1 hypothetical protein SAMN04488108_0133 [Algoriphagus zhangzhouensis]
MKIRHLLIYSVILLLVNPVFAQEEKSSEQLAKELANPNATVGQMLFPIDYVRYNGSLNDANQGGLVMSFQPSLPIPLSEGLNLYVRPLIPIYISQPVLGDAGFEKKGALGNISADIAVGKSWPSKWVTLVGVFGGFPTASNDALKAKQVTLGPEFLVAKLTNFGVLGLMVSQAWGVGDPTDPDAGTSTILSDDYWLTAEGAKSAKVTAGQYFYTINLTKGWQITASPTYSYNHNGTKGNKFTFPIGTGAQKVLLAGKMPIRVGFQYWYYISSPEAFGPQHQFRFTFAPVVPLPW